MSINVKFTLHVSIYSHIMEIFSFFDNIDLHFKHMTVLTESGTSWCEIQTFYHMLIGIVDAFVHW